LNLSPEFLGVSILPSATIKGGQSATGEIYLAEACTLTATITSHSANVYFNDHQSSMTLDLTGQGSIADFSIHTVAHSFDANTFIIVTIGTKSYTVPITVTKSP